MTFLRDMIFIWHCWCVKNNNFLRQRVKWRYMRSQKFISCLLHSHSPTLSFSHSLDCALSLICTLTHCLALALSVLPLTLSLFIRLCALELSLYVSSPTRSLGSSSSLRSSSTSRVRQHKVGFFYVWKTCKGCCFNCFFIQKDVFFLFIEWFPCEVWFLCGFWWKRSFGWFNSSVLGGCWIWKV